MDGMMHEISVNQTKQITVFPFIALNMDVETY